ncbi:ArsR/SmtB family transcription factor [Nocardiopsis salina]|uniref:ArsR/SmtB family transcription factor n=1 Tax=Nocardiopsis salina TaxID=245836 RepID=UPI000344F1C6|nr:helix-turn-helix domain-containing protein [Nocardiopsis salina]
MPSPPSEQEAAPALLHPARADLDLTEVLCAIAEPNRLRVVALLLALPPGSGRPYPWFDLPVRKAGRTHHFRVLREAGLIAVEQHGNRATARLRSEDIEERFPGLLSAVQAGAQPHLRPNEP